MIVLSRYWSTLAGLLRDLIIYSGRAVSKTGRENWVFSRWRRDSQETMVNRRAMSRFASGITPCYNGSMKATGGRWWSSLFVGPIFLLVLWRVGSKLCVVVDLHTVRIISSCSTWDNYRRIMYGNTWNLRENIKSVAVSCDLFHLLVVRSAWTLLSRREIGIMENPRIFSGGKWIY